MTKCNNGGDRGYREVVPIVTPAKAATINSTHIKKHKKKSSGFTAIPGLPVAPGSKGFEL
jgi:hypothetical protein